MRTLIAVPCMSMVYADFMVSLVTLDKPAGTELMVQKNTLIYDARNRIAASAIQRDFDYVFWVDSDMSFEPDAMARLLEDAKDGRHFVSGLYFTRHRPIMPSLFRNVVYERSADGKLDSHGDVMETWPQDSLFETKGSGFACVVTSTQLLFDVWQRFGAPFTPMERLGEDIGFCWKAAQCGYRLWTDSRVKVGHVGEYTYTDRDYGGQ